MIPPKKKTQPHPVLRRFALAMADFETAPRCANGDAPVLPLFFRPSTTRRDRLQGGEKWEKKKKEEDEEAPPWVLEACIGDPFLCRLQQSSQGEDPSMIDSDVYTYEELTKRVVVDPAERKRLAALGIRPLKRESKLSQGPISNAIHGKPIKLRTLEIIRQAAARISPK